MHPQRETTRLGDLVVPRLFIGLWQLSSPSWGTAPATRVRREMLRHVRAGYNAFGQCEPFGITVFPSHHLQLLPNMSGHHFSSCR